jgi:hypothetical protein
LDDVRNAVAQSRNAHLACAVLCHQRLQSVARDLSQGWRNWLADSAERQEQQRPTND